MGIIRSFDVACDKCGHHNDNPSPSATYLRQMLKQDGWTISGNKFTCGNCNGNWTPEPESDTAA
jgi:hypothetical protein